MSRLFRPFMVPAQTGFAGWLIVFATHWSDGRRRKQMFCYPRPNGEVRPEADAQPSCWEWLFLPHFGPSAAPPGLAQESGKRSLPLGLGRLADKARAGTRLWRGA